MGPKQDITGFEGCSLPSALEVMGERWSFLILRAAVNGIEHFEDFQASLGIARNILSSRLVKLVEHGILSRTPMEEDKRKVAYRLTAKGQGLVPAMVALRQWGEKWSKGAPCTSLLVDRRDGLPIRAIAILSADGRELGLDELCWVDSPVGQDDGRAFGGGSPEGLRSACDKAISG
ncbi:MAG: helix-turn-helix domain-containing protein [Sphingobium sp.]